MIFTRSDVRNSAVQYLFYGHDQIALKYIKILLDFYKFHSLQAGNGIV